jgi:hypothetical protein
MFILALLSLAQAEPLPTVFGFQLGAPIVLPECERGTSGRYSMDQSQTCERKPGESPKRPNSGFIDFLPSKMPTIVGFNWVTTTVIDGKLEALSAQTLKYTVAEGVIDELTRKFGTPTSRENETVDVDSVPFPSIHVTWDRPGYSVDYHSVNDRNIKYGILRVETNKARALREQQDAAQTENRTPL